MVLKTGIILKTDGHKAVVLKSDGSFASVDAKNGWRVGQTVPVSNPARRRAARYLAMAACLVMAVTGVGWKLYAAPVALVSLDMNPSLELSVNRFHRIISATAFNGESSRILTEAGVKNEDCREALVNILNAGESDGYLTGEANVVLTVFSRDASTQASLLAQLQGAVDSRVSHCAGQIKTEYHAVDENTVSDAHGHGVTAGKYLYLMKLQSLEPETDISGLTHHSIEQIKGEIETCRQKHGAGGGPHHGKRHQSN